MKFLFILNDTPFASAGVINFVKDLFFGNMNSVIIYGFDLSSILFALFFLLSTFYAFLQLWVIPDFVFGKHLEDVRNKAAMAKAAELDIAELFTDYDILWATGEFSRRNDRLRPAITAGKLQPPCGPSLGIRADEMNNP